MCFKNAFTPSQTAVRNQQLFEAQQAAAEKAKQDAQAEQQRQQLLQQEADRKANIATGNSNIDKAFGGFDDDYYGKATSTYTGAYLPLVDQQTDRAMDQLKASLQGRGMLESSVGASAIADLEGNAANERAKIANQGTDFVNGIKNKVADAKTNLYSQSSSSADPNAIASAATGQASSLAQQGQATQIPNLGDLFGSFLTPFINASSAAQNSAWGLANQKKYSAAPTTGAGSSRVVQS